MTWALVFPRPSSQAGLLCLVGRLSPLAGSERYWEEGELNTSQQEQLGIEPVQACTR